MTDAPHERGRHFLALGMAQSGLTYEQLWLRQISVGGDAGPLELEAYLLGVLTLDEHQHDLMAQAMNEHFLDRGQDHPVPYSDLAGPDLLS